VSKSFDCEYIVGNYSGKGCNLSSDEIWSICKSDLDKIYENDNLLENSSEDEKKNKK